MRGGRRGRSEEYKYRKQSEWKEESGGGEKRRGEDQGEPGGILIREEVRN